MDLALLVVYTPDREHFGIVPIEAMFLSTPVLAVNSGGPKETVVQKETGFLREAEPQFFAESMAIAVENQELMEEYGVAGRLILL
jgi:alpha-1,3/alpha-1,6-mannosyltransferase